MGVKSCRNAQKEQAFKDYNRDVGAFVQESEDQSKGLFDLLEKGGQSPVELQNTVNGYASEAAQLVDRAKGTDHPGELDEAHGYLVETLEFRRDGLKGIADDLPQALGDRGEEATQNIAAQMQNFLTSDVIYAALLPAAPGPAEGRGLLDSEKPPRARSWPTSSGSCRARSPTASAGSARARAATSGPAAPGLHGTGLGTVSVQPGGHQLNEGARRRSRRRRTCRSTSRWRTRARTTRRT